VVNLMLSWQQAGLLAAGLGAAGVLLVHAGQPAGSAGDAPRREGFAPGLSRRWAAKAGPFAREAGVVVALYSLWQLAGNLAAGGFDHSIAHAWRIWQAERATGLPSEVSIQHLVLPHPLLSQIANLYYATMHFGMLIAMLIWLFARHREGYPKIRNAMAATTALCLVISFIPVAPPRMLTSLGFVDLAARYSQSVYAAVGSAAGADQLSAMPSVHVAWSLLVAWAVITKSTSRWRWLIIAHPAATVFVVVATGNHYWADGIISALIVAVVLSLQAFTGIIRRKTRPRVKHARLAAEWGADEAGRPNIPSDPSGAPASGIDQLLASFGGDLNGAVDDLDAHRRDATWRCLPRGLPQLGPLRPHDSRGRPSP